MSLQFTSYSVTGHDYSPHPPGNMDPRFSKWISKSSVRLHQVATEARIQPMSSVQRHQCHSWFNGSTTQPLRSDTNLNPIEDLLVRDQPPDKPVSCFYQTLLSIPPIIHQSFLAKWEKEFQSPLSDIQHIFTILQLSHISSISSKTTEVNYKMLTRWHYTTVVLHKSFPTLPDLCWQGCGNQGNSCPHLVVLPVLRSYWTAVLYWIKEIQGSEIPNDPWVVLFHCTDEPAGSYKRTITPHLPNAPTKALILKLWKQQAIHTQGQWLREVDLANKI